MHISEGVLSAPVLLAGGAFAIGGLIIGIRKLNPDHIVLCGTLAAAFFVASLAHVPVGVGSAHLVLNGLLGVILGWSAFPAIFVALILQALLFQYGGLTTLGINTFTMGTAAVCSRYIFMETVKHFPSTTGIRVGAFAGGFAGVLISGVLTAFALAFTSEGFLDAAIVLLVSHLPVMIVEGLITMFAVVFLVKVKPAMLSMPITIKRSTNEI